MFFFAVYNILLQKDLMSYQGYYGSHEPMYRPRK